ncbi:CAHS5 [Ramazzottius varieornatus]|uniref:CAHS5 n=1 Tax=Ramazzottius varieornatus TaxID=947166 RepID=A0A1D1UPC3_RAMVA|nr:CAHS5 [Ramazzottius varieornatus]
MERTVEKSVEVRTTGSSHPSNVTSSQYTVERETTIPATLGDATYTGTPYPHGGLGHSSSQSSSDSQERVTNYTHTEVRVPQVSMPAPIIVTSASGLAEEMVGSGFTASASRVTGSSVEQMVQESPALHQKSLEEAERHDHELAKVTEKMDHKMEKKAEKYRKEAEKEADKIRKLMEKQHEKDVEFRKELVETSIEKQKKEIEIEAKHAKAELEHERQLALEALERSKMTSNVEVNFDTSVGQTVSESHVGTHRTDISHPRM